MEWSFTVIHHRPRKALGLTQNEYSILDTIYKTQVHPIFTKSGWAYLGAHRLAGAINLSPATVLYMFDDFVEWGLLELHPENKALKRTTAAWYNFVYFDKWDTGEGVQLLNGVQKVNRKRSKIERRKVQLLNGNRSIIEHNKKEANFKSKYKGKKPPKITPLEKFLKEHLTGRSHINIILKLEKKPLELYNALDDEQRLMLFEWLNYKTKSGKSYKANINLPLNILNDCTIDEARYLIDYSKDNGYQGLFIDKLKRKQDGKRNNKNGQYSGPGAQQFGAANVETIIGAAAEALGEAQRDRCTAEDVDSLFEE